MIHLLTCGFRRTRGVRLTLLGVAAALEIVFIATVYACSRPATVLSGLLLFFLSLGGTMAAGLAGVLLLHRDLTTEEGYMVFLTPRRCWTVLGASMLETLISLALCAAFFTGLIYFDVRFLFAHQGQIHGVWKIGTEFLNDPTFYMHELFDVDLEIPIRIDLRDGTLIICAFLCYVATWESYMATAAFSVVLADTVFPGRRRAVIAAFLIFSVIAFLLHWAQTALPVLEPYQRSLLLASGLALSESLLMYLIAAPVMEGRLSV